MCEVFCVEEEIHDFSKENPSSQKKKCHLSLTKIQHSGSWKKMLKSFSGNKFSLDLNVMFCVDVMKIFHKQPFRVVVRLVGEGTKRKTYISAATRGKYVVRRSNV